jgi:toxin ParE1/3/4
LAKLEDGFMLLARNRSIGRATGSLQSGLRRFEIGEHVVFYLAETGGVLIVRVLHERMMPGRYL